MRSIELTLDDATDAAVRVEWRALADAGLPSLASHTAASNRPHVTIVAGAVLDPSAVPLAAFAALPLPARFGALATFPAGRDRFVLIRTVVVSRELVALHSAVLSTAVEPVATSAPGFWTPHVTLARRLTAEQVGIAHTLLRTPPDGTFTAARFWDGESKTVTPLAP